MTYSGSCHCGRFRFEVEGTLGAVVDCDCSICRKARFLHWIVEAGQVRVLAGMEDLGEYVWGTGVARHHFCRICGVAPLRRPRMKPEEFSVNVRCLDGVDLARLTVEPYAGTALPV